MQNKNIYTKIQNSVKKKLAVLIDPDKQSTDTLIDIVKIANKYNVDLFLVGGSIVFENIEITISAIKEHSEIPVLLFPGNILQISDKADGILLLSLISGRNPEFLIGNHVLASPFLKKSNLEIIPVGYMLIDGGKRTSVEYMSNTKPIPNDKTDIAVATAIAGEITGNKMIYLEAGSGAKNMVSENIISEVKKNIDIPLMVGGGINTVAKIKKACKAGADIIVIGTAFEKNNQLIKDFSEIIHEFSGTL